MANRRIGIAGYMGSGKSTAARMLAARGYAVIDADREAKTLMNSDTVLRRRLTSDFGGSIVLSGVISFRALGTIVFGAPERLRQLNALVHPPLLERLRTLVDRQGGGPWVLDAALIPLWRIESWFDRCVWIHAAAEARLRRLLAAAADIGESELRARMRLQEEIMPAPASAPWCVIENGEDVPHLGESLEKLGI